MVSKGLRLGVRGIIVRDGRLLLVNAFAPGKGPELWCAPGGGVRPHSSLPDNLAREIHEETGLSVRVGLVALVNEFHSPEDAFHQVEVFFRCEITNGEIDDSWQDPSAIVNRRRFFSPGELTGLAVKPTVLPELAFQPEAPVRYDPLERMVR